MGGGEGRSGWIRDWVILSKRFLPKPLMLGLEGEGRRGRAGWIRDWVILSKRFLPMPLMLGLEGEGRRECRGGGEEQDGEGGGGDLLPKPWFLIANCLNMKVFY